MGRLKIKYSFSVNIGSNIICFIKFVIIVLGVLSSWVKFVRVSVSFILNIINVNVRGNNILVSIDVCMYMFFIKEVFIKEIFY